MHTTGFSSSYIDKKYDFSYKDVDKMSIHHQRELFNKMILEKKKPRQISMLKNTYQHLKNRDAKDIISKRNAFTPLDYQVNIERRRMKVKRPQYLLGSMNLLQQGQDYSSKVETPQGYA